MASYVVAASLFILGTSYLIQFVVEPPGSSTASLEHLELKSKGQQAMEVLLGTPGIPATWNESTTSIEATKRSGLLEAGTSIRINSDKFDAIARGKFATASNTNGAVDYAELKTDLGLDGYEFHLRAYPVPSQAGDNYGLDDFDSFRVAYVGDVSGETYANSAKSEASALENLSIVFLNKTRTSTTTGDVFQDDSGSIRTHLLPSLGATLQQSVISAGAGTKYDFYRVNKSSYQDLVPLNASGAGLSKAMALSSDGVTLGYTKNREIRSIVGTANLSGASEARLHWWEWVDTDRGNGTYDCGDYGYVEVSADNGTNWVKLTDTAAARSQDCNVLPGAAHPNGMIAGEVAGADIIAACAACANKHMVLVAFHWVADNDNTIGYGWVVDNVRVETGPVLSPAITFSKTFESPDYDLLVVGSNVDHNAMTPAEVKDGIRDYVNLHGGRVVVLGGQSNVQWLDRLFDAAIGGASGGLNTPDITHPLLNLPNTLNYGGYSPATPWDFTSSEDAALFTMITGADTTHHYLSASRAGAWGSGGSNDGAVILTSYEPHEFSEDESRRFFANSIVYGRFHYLHLEVGPPVPTGEAVASVSRSALMNKYRDGTVNYTEIAFVMYVWPGQSTAATASQYSVNPLPVQSLAASAVDGMIYVNWTPPTSTGTGDGPHAYEIWRGTSPNAMSLHKNISYTAFNAGNRSFLDWNSTSNGQTYWYNVTVWNEDAGRGTVATAVSATPFALPSAPGNLAASTAVPMKIALTWDAPANAGIGSIYGYTLWINNTSSSTEFHAFAELGNVNAYDFYPPGTEQYYFNVSAINARGYGPNATKIGPFAASFPSPVAAPATTVTQGVGGPNVTIAWTPPADFLGQNPAGYRIWRSAGASDADYSQLVYLTSPANVSFTDVNVGAGAATTRYYKVQAVTDVRDGTNSTAASATTLGLASAPSFSISNATAGQLVLTWSTVTPPVGSGSTLYGYKIDRSPNGVDSWTQLVSLGQPTGAANVSFIDATVTANTTYHYRMKTVTDVGDGAASASSSKQVLGAPWTPTITHAWSDVTNILTFTVTPVSDGGSAITHCEIWKGTSSGSETLDSTVVIAANTCATTQTTAGTFYYKIKTKNVIGTSPLSNEISIVSTFP